MGLEDNSGNLMNSDFRNLSKGQVPTSSNPQSHLELGWRDRDVS